MPLAHFVFRAHAPPHNAAASGLRSFPEATSFRICFSSESSATKRFSLAFSQLQAAVLFSPAVVRLHRDFSFFARLRRVFPFAISTSTCRSSVTICSACISSSHVQLLYRVILSHSRWTHSSRSRRKFEELDFTRQALEPPTPPRIRPWTERNKVPAGLHSSKQTALGLQVSASPGSYPAESVTRPSCLYVRSFRVQQLKNPCVRNSLDTFLIPPLHLARNSVRLRFTSQAQANASR